MNGIRQLYFKYLPTVGTSVSAGLLAPESGVPAWTLDTVFGHVVCARCAVVCCAVMLQDG